MKTALCDTLGIDYPIIAAPMGPDITGPELVAAVSNAGGLGILQAQFCTPPVFRQEIRRGRPLRHREPARPESKERICPSFFPWHKRGKPCCSVAPKRTR